ncbi:BEN domain-containing protein 6 isoform X1 [Lepisosteus oculatus]|uniref:BEN domain-containing protein 6 isoform X1 n=1 Tax=Lepisosteus oculatus TaxID=7918 RepID=UPI0037175113
MRRKTKAKRVLDHEHEEEEEQDEDDEDQRDEIDVRTVHSKVLCHGLQKRRKQMYSAKEKADENSPDAGLQKLKMRAFDFENPTMENFTDSDSTPEDSDYLQSRSKSELIAMVLCMQREMENLKEQIRCLTACGKLARNLEALIERTQVWSSAADKDPSPSMPQVQVEGEAMMPAVLASPAVLNGQWVKQDSQAQDGQPEPHQDSQRNGLPLFPEFISLELLDRCNTTATAQKLTNDLLRGLYERECLASHSISGIVYNKRGQPKPALPADEVQAILRTVQYFFPGKTDAEIKGYIRQKLQNEAKRLRRKPHLSAKTEVRGESSPDDPAYT